MSTRAAQRILAATLLVAGATALGTGVANAGLAPAPAYHHHHWNPNCNNDPDSEYAMDPSVCPPSHNAGAHYEEYGYGYPGDYGYGYPRY